MSPSEKMEIQIDPRERHRPLPDAPGHWWYEWTGSVLLVCRDSATQRLFFPAGEWAPERMWITDALAGLAAPFVKKAPVVPPRRWYGMGFYDTLVPLESVEFKALAGASFRYNALLEVWEHRGASNPLFKGGTLADEPQSQFYIAGKV